MHNGERGINMIIRVAQDELLEGELVNALTILEKTEDSGFTNLFCIYRKDFGKLGSEIAYVRKNQPYIIKIPNAYRNLSGILLLRIYEIKATNSKYEGLPVKVIQFKGQMVRHIEYVDRENSLVAVPIRGKIYKLQYEHSLAVKAQGWAGFVYKDVSPWNKGSYLLAVDLYEREKIAERTKV